MNIDVALIDINPSGKISLYKNIEEKIDNKLCITQYSREEISKRLLHIGIKLNNFHNTNNLSVFIGSEDTKINLIYDEDTGYFYHKSCEGEEEIGISKAGFFKVFVLNDKKEQIYKSEPILVKPSIISQDMYEDMVDMLLNINKDLAVDNSSSVYLNTKNKESNFSIKLLDFLMDIQKCIENIELNPSVTLTKEEVKLPYHKIKKVNRKILIEKEMYPFKNKFISSVSVENKDTYENRAIYSFLINIKKLVDTNIANCDELIKKANKELSTIISTNISSNDGYEIRLANKKAKILENIASFNSEKSNYNKCIEIINKYLNLSLFRIYKNINMPYEPLKLTQIFLHDKWYKGIYTKIKSFNEENNFELDELGSEELNLKEVYDIFETWSFFKMIKIMIKEQGWRLVDSKNIIKNLNEYIKNNGSMYGFKVILNHNLPFKQTQYFMYDKQEVSIEIIYNKTLVLADKKLRPDFTFIVKCRDKIKNFYLDAKYHNYLEFNDLFIRDMKETAVDKYYNALINTEYKSSGSFIIHCIDKENYRYFGHDTTFKHRIGSFALTNENSNNFITWISMIMEWFYDEYETCWQCGSLNVDIELGTTQGNNSKYHYTCEECGSFWVKSHCICNSSNKLIKHDLPQKQYHKPTKEKWMVHCPACGKSGLENRSTQSTTNKTIYTQSNRVCDKCGGSGSIRMYKHIEDGVCFKCGGSGRI